MPDVCNVAGEIVISGMYIAKSGFVAWLSFAVDHSPISGAVVKAIEKSRLIGIQPNYRCMSESIYLLKY